MKKIITLLLAVLLLIVPCAIGASAAGAINAAEQKILDKLDETFKIGKTEYHISDEYINQAKNYFLTADLSDTVATAVIAEIDKGVKLVQAETLPDEEFHMEILPTEVKEDILATGQAACAAAGLTLTYNANTTKVEITKVENNAPVIVFTAEPIVKATGAEADFTAIIATVSVCVLVLVASFAVSKKVKLF